MYYKPGRVQKLDSPFDKLPVDPQANHLWAQGQQSLAAAEKNERTWSPEYFALWQNGAKSSALESIPLIVLTRAQGGFKDLDITAAQQESERESEQVQLVALSTRGEPRIIECGEDMQVEAPDAVAKAIQDMLKIVRQSHEVRRNSQ
jgi:hypothetical protein